MPETTKIPCPDCEFENPAGMNYCGMCGAALPQRCLNCDSLNPPNFRFCGQCGAPLDGALARVDEQASHQTETEPSAPPAEAGAPTAPPAPKQSTPPPTEQPETVTRNVEGERRVATILLADVQRSTDLLENIGTERWWRS
jgi:hypothetical protein